MIFLLQYTRSTFNVCKYHSSYARIFYLYRLRLRMCIRPHSRRDEREQPLACEDGGPIASSTSPQTTQGPDLATRTRAKHHRYTRYTNTLVCEIARAAALAAKLTSRGHPRAPSTSPRSQTEQLRPRTPRARAMSDLRAAEQRCGTVSHYVQGIWAGIGAIRGFRERAAHRSRRLNGAY